MQSFKHEELAWAAGFMDGEAHFGLVASSNKNKHIHIQVCQTEDGPLERLQNILGRGKIYGPYNAKKADGSARKPYKQFHIDSFEQVQYAICLLWTWLSRPKKNQIIKMMTGYVEYSHRPKTSPGPKLQPKQFAECHPHLYIKARGFCNPCYRKLLRDTKYEK